MSKDEPEPKQHSNPIKRLLSGALRAFLHTSPWGGGANVFWSHTAHQMGTDHEQKRRRKYYD